jgi:hypothetical protein
MSNTTTGHGKLPYPPGTLVEDTISERTGHLVGVIEKRLKDSGKVVSAQAFPRPEGGGKDTRDQGPGDNLHAV